MNTLRLLFDGKDPSINLFKKAIELLSDEEQNKWYINAYKLGFQYWPELSKKYQNFIVRLAKHDREHFLMFMQEQTMLSQFQYILQQPDLVKKLFNLVEGFQLNKDCSLSDLAFVLLLVFKFDKKRTIKTLQNELRYMTFTPEELNELKGKATIDTGQITERKQVTNNKQ